MILTVIISIPITLVNDKQFKNVELTVDFIQNLKYVYQPSNYRHKNINEKERKLYKIVNIVFALYYPPTITYMKNA